MSRFVRLMRILTLHCEEASELASRELDEPLPRLDRVSLLCHLAVCHSCRRFREQIRLIRLAVRGRERLLVEDEPSDEVLSTEARDRIALAIRTMGRDEPGPGTMPK